MEVSLYDVITEWNIKTKYFDAWILQPHLKMSGRFPSCVAEDVWTYDAGFVNKSSFIIYGALTEEDPSFSPSPPEAVRGSVSPPKH